MNVSDEHVTKFIENCTVQFVDHPDCDLLGFSGILFDSHRNSENYFKCVLV
jgi:hypothetical protein